MNTIVRIVTLVDLPAFNLASCLKRSTICIYNLTGVHLLLFESTEFYFSMDLVIIRHLSVPSPSSSK